MSGRPVSPELQRGHLEALLVALALLDPGIADGVDDARLSPAAIALLDYVITDPVLAASCLTYGARDEYQLRLAERVERLTVPQLVFFEPATLVALVNQLPELGMRRAA